MVAGAILTPLSVILIFLHILFLLFEEREDTLLKG